MIVVNGVNNSGFEAVLASFSGTLGERRSADVVYRNRDGVKKFAPGEIPAYEAYIDKFSPASPEAVIKDITDRLPDGTWPPYNMHPDPVRAVMGGTIVVDAACRMGGSLFYMEPAEISKIYIVLASPAVVRFRRAVMRHGFRVLDMKYANDRLYPVAVSMELRGCDTSVDGMLKEYTMFKDYVNNCLARFGDKVVFIDGETEELVFEKAFGSVTVPNRNNPAAVLPGGTTDARKAVGADLGSVYAVWDELRELAARRDPKPMTPPRYDAPTAWFCARTHKMVGVTVCHHCIATAGDHVMADARPGWDKEPCAFEVAYGPEPHKTVEDSVARHNWSVLP